MLEPTTPSTATRSNWQGEKPKPNYSRKWSPVTSTVFRSRVIRMVILLFFVVCAIALYLILPPRGEPEHDIVKATKEYNDYLASPRHRALIYPLEEDRAEGNA